MSPKRPSSGPPPPADASYADREQAVEEANQSSASPHKSSPPKNPTNGPPKPTDPTNVEEEEDGADDGSGSDAEEADKNPPLQPPPPPPPNDQKPAPKTSEPGSTDDDGGEDEESSSDEEPPPPQRPSRGADPSIKPMNSRPMDGSPVAKRTAGAFRSNKRRSSSLRPSSEPKRQHFQRLWGLEDEMTILHGLERYHAKKGALPASTQDMERLHKLIRGSLSVEVTILQLSDKVRRLRKKFADASAQGKHGADPTFPSDHERDMFELSKKVWGSKSAAAESDEEVRSDESNGDVGRSLNAKETNYASPILVPKNRKGSAPRSIAMANGNVGSDDKKVTYPYLLEVVDELAKEHPSGAVFKRAFVMLDDSKAKAMEEKIRKHRLAEIRHNVHRMDLMKATVKLVLDALEASGQ